MKSIRRYLCGRLIAGTAAVWVLAGVGLFLIVRHSLLTKVDAELELLASEARLLLPEARHLRASDDRSRHAFDFFVPQSGVYFEVWWPDAIFSDRSPSLGELELPRPAAFGRDPVFWNDTLATGERVRAIGVALAIPPPAGAGGEGYTAHVVVARDRGDLDRALGLLVAAIAAAGAILVLLSGFVVWLALRGGLEPLEQLARQAATIGPGTLSRRFDGRDRLPRELHPIANRLNDLLDRLEAGFERERRFSSNLAHELRTPIAELTAMSEYALQWPEEADAAGYADVRQVAGQMQALVENLLAVVRVERDAAQAEWTDVALSEAIEEGFRPLAGEVARKALDVSVRLEEGPIVRSNAVLLGVILTNLLSNAVAYTPAGGRITIEGRVEAGGGFRLRIGNSVEGVAASELPLFFERMWRRDASRTDKAHHGLGLPLAKTCAEAMGYRLTASLDASSTFLTFELV